MQTKLIIALAALALAGPGMALSAPTGSGGGSSGGYSGGGGGGGGSSHGGGGGGGGSGAHGGSAGAHGGGSGFAHGSASGRGGFATRSGGWDSLPITQMTHGAARAVRISSAAHAMPIENRTRPTHPGRPRPRGPKMPRVARTLSCYADAACLQTAAQPNLFCMEPLGVDDQESLLNCPRAVKTREVTGPGPTR